MDLWPFKKTKRTKHFESLAARLDKRRDELAAEFEEKHQGVTKWAKERGIKTEDLASKGARGLAAAVAAGALLLTPSLPNTTSSAKKVPPATNIEALVKTRKDLSDKVKASLLGTNLYDDKVITKRLSKVLKIPVTGELSGIRLNTTYGIIGYESHLSRYPEEILEDHFDSRADFERYAHASMAGGPGAWGYLASSRETLTKKDIEREKYYLVAQTFLSPNWGSPAVKRWFRHRKMVVVNPQNGAVVVGAIEDSGPDEATGRSFGGSPEVMAVLGFSGGGDRVLVYFVNDPKDKIPLGAYGL